MGDKQEQEVKDDMFTQRYNNNPISFTSKIEIRIITDKYTQIIKTIYTEGINKCCIWYVIIATDYGNHTFVEQGWQVGSL